MRREAGTFSCPEHAIAVAYLMLAYPIEPKNPTQIVCDALRELFDVEYERKALSGLSPHEWHAQAVFITKVLQRTLGNSVGFHILQAQYGTSREGAISARRVSEWLNPNAPAVSQERRVTDKLAAHILRGRPRLRELCDEFDLPYSSLQRPASAYRVLVEGARRAALQRLDVRMRDADIVVDLEEDVLPTSLDNVNQDRQNSPILGISTH